MSVTAGVLVASAAVSAYGQFKASRAEAKLLKQQAAMAERSAAEILRLNEENTRLVREDIKKTQGAAKTKFAASGAESNLEILASIAQDGEQEIRFRTEQAEWEASMQSFEAMITRENAESTRRAGTLGGVGTLLGGLAPVFKAAADKAGDADKGKGKGRRRRKRPGTGFGQGF